MDFPTSPIGLTEEDRSVAARRERKRLAWLQMMTGVMGNSSLDMESAESAMTWAMNQYNESWETPAPAPKPEKKKGGK